MEVDGEKPVEFDLLDQVLGLESAPRAEPVVAVAEREARAADAVATSGQLCQVPFGTPPSGSGAAWPGGREARGPDRPAPGRQWVPFVSLTDGPRQPCRERRCMYVPRADSKTRELPFRTVRSDVFFLGDPVTLRPEGAILRQGSSQRTGGGA